MVSEEINNMLGQGQAIVQGQEWSARSVEDNGIIKKNELVEVVSVSGVKLMVKKVKGE